MVPSPWTYFADISKVNFSWRKGSNQAFTLEGQRLIFSHLKWKC